MKRKLFAVVLGLLALSCTVNAEEKVMKRVGLGRYRLSAGPVVLAGLDDLSGATIDKARGKLVMVLNKPPIFVEVDISSIKDSGGSISDYRTVPLAGFHDTEGVVWLGGEKFGILEERRRNLVIAEVPARARTVNYARCKKALIEPREAANLGLEGLTYDAVGDRYFVVKEKEPRKIYEVKLGEGRKPEPKVTHPWDFEARSAGMDDLAGVHYHQETGNILVLSDESKCVVEFTPAGKEVSRLKLKPGMSGLKEKVAQPEGITMDDQGNLYICSEPNVIYMFSIF